MPSRGWQAVVEARAPSPKVPPKPPALEAITSCCGRQPRKLETPPP